jgi:hypothetical protein
MKIDHHPANFLITQLNALLDTGQFDHIPRSAVHAHAAARDTLEWLKSIAGQEFDISVYGADGPWTWFDPYLKDFLESMANVSDDSRHWHVKNRGLCLLIAWTNGLLQQGTGWKPAEDIPRNRSPD